MTTKYKIIIGFSLMVCMLTVGGALGYIKLYEASEGFAVYQIYSKTAVDANGADALMRGAQDQLSRFRLNTNQEHVKQALAFAERAINYYLAEAKLAENNPQELMMLDGQIERIKQFMRLAEDMQQKLTAGTRMVDEQLASSSRETNTALRGMAEIARGIGNYTILEIIDTATNYYANARVWVRHYSDIFLESSAANAEQDLAAFGAALKKLESLILSGENKQTLSKLLQRYEEYVNNFKTVKTLLEEGLLAQRRIDALSAELIKEFDAYKARAEKNMSAIGQATQASNIQGQRIILAGSVFGFFIGMLAAFLIIMGITKVLKNASSLAVTIANGDFQARIGPHEGGEIGEMLDSLQKISTILQSVLNDYNNLETRIVAGELDAKPDPSAYKGDFARLITDTDAILERFLQVLENIPSPVLVMGKDLKVTYVNAITRRLCGGDYKGKTDPQLSRREDDGSPTDAVKKAAATLQPATAETRAHPQGMDMDISYTSIPMLDHEGKLASVLQLVTDLTATKQTQRAVHNVAEQAVSISNRVAVAAEELSAQVEEVSRGAEMQSTRVGSTATAMTEMNASVMEVAKNAGQASEQSDMTKTKANAGASLVDNVVQAINQVNKIAEMLQTSMRELGTQAESIGGVMNVISDIADQTNLLALNAAIEAARAGEAGRGFAVVADEVRKLAEKTMSATQEVGANITAIQHSAHTNINEVNKAAKAITEATDLANTSGQALSEIVHLASDNSSLVTSIATAAEEQSATSEEINHAIEEINRIVGETTEGMVHASAAIQELSKMAQELNTVMDELR